MNESDNDFEGLRRLLALKRHEIPPPGYFNNFSRQVLARIRAGETEAPQALTAPSWLLKFFQAFEGQPVYVGSFACSLCLLLLVGIIYAERPDAAAKSSFFAAVAPPAVSLANATTPMLAAAEQPTGLMISTNPVISLQPVSSLFNQHSPLAMPVNSVQVDLALPVN